jgi:hypothetical protein
MAVRRWLGDTLMNAGLVTRQQLDEALSAQSTFGQKLGQTLVSLGYLTDTALLQTLCADAGIPFLSQAEMQAEPGAVALIPVTLARTHVAVPLKLESRHLVMAMADPFDLLSIRALTRAAGRSVRVVGAERDSVLHAIDRAYAGSAGAAAAAATAAPGVAVASGAAAPATGRVTAAVPRLELARGEGAPARGFNRPGWPAATPAGTEDSAATVVDDMNRSTTSSAFATASTACSPTARPFRSPRSPR